MSPLAQAKQLEKRVNNCYGYGYYYDYYSNDCSYSGWNAYGRWILLAAIIIGCFLLFLLFSCITARRRRRIGMQPYPMTGWASRPPPGHGPAQYTGPPQQQPYYGGPSPQPQYEGGYNQPPSYQQGGYYGGPQGQESGIAQPNPTYQGQRGGDAVYDAPEGPPPGKKGDGIVR